MGDGGGDTSGAVTPAHVSCGCGGMCCHVCDNSIPLLGWIRVGWLREIGGGGTLIQMTTAVILLMVF